MRNELFGVRMMSCVLKFIYKNLISVGLLSDNIDFPNVS